MQDPAQTAEMLRTALKGHSARVCFYFLTISLLTGNLNRECPLDVMIMFSEPEGKASVYLRRPQNYLK